MRKWIDLLIVIPIEI